jgi:AcrR family transcriptional regulator
VKNCEGMSSPSFQRARHPQQKEERRIGLLQAAEHLLGERGDVRAFSLTELAREAGMAKSNVYRYFETRESLLLELLEDQWKAWLEDFAEAETEGVTRALPGFCDHVAKSLEKHTLLCTLMGALPSVLEQNASVETVRAFKSNSLHFVSAVAELFHASCPDLSKDEYEQFVHLLFLFQTSLWSFAHPAPPVKLALEDPALSAFRRDFSRDLSHTLLLLARGMIASRTSP